MRKAIPLTPTTLSFVLLVLQVAADSRVVSVRGAIRPIFQQGLSILVTRFGKLATSDAGVDNTKGGLQVDSDFPVSSLRFYRENGYFIGGEPMEEDFVSVVVKSDCTRQELRAANQWPQVSFGRNPDTGYMDTVSVKKAQGAPTVAVSRQGDTESNIDVDDLSFLPASTYNARWSYRGYWCSAGYNRRSGGNGGDDEAAAAKQSVPHSAYYDSLNGHDRRGLLGMDSSAASGSIRHGHAGLVWAMIMTMLGMFLVASSSNTNGGHRYSLSLCLLAFVSVVLVVRGLDDSNVNDSTPQQQRQLQQSTPNKICKINVEILHAGCRVGDLQVTAPKRRYGNAQSENYNSQQDAKDECLTRYREDMVFPDTVFTVLRDDSDKDMPQVPQDSCSYMIEGRPFVDAQGQTIMASAFHAAPGGSSTTDGWCAAPAGERSLVQPSIIETETTTASATVNKNETSTTIHKDKEPTATTISDDDVKTLRVALGREWTRRALGEHSSIASFAAFTIALMSLPHTPPALVQDALVAASDEVRHAQVAFQAATKFTGRPVEPGPLPPSTHAFGNNITAVALATAQEGCIDETLSALLASLEVDFRQHHWGWLPDDKEQVWLQESVTTIAMEEASHAALAWRTLQWVCEEDDDSACEVVQKHVLNIPNLQQAVQKRFQDRSADEQQFAAKAWSYIYQTLLQVLATPNNDDKTKAIQAGTDLLNGLPPLTAQVVEKIVQGVLGTLDVATK